MAACEECGAPVVDGLDCRGQWEELLALEFSDARAGRVHFHTVACYQLQHPRAFPLTAGARDQLRRALADVVLGGTTVSEVRGRVGDAFDGEAAVLSPEAAPMVVQRWSCTVADVWPPDPERHAVRVEDWARAVLNDLDAS